MLTAPVSGLEIVTVTSPEGAVLRTTVKVPVLPSSLTETSVSLTLMPGTSSSITETATVRRLAGELCAGGGKRDRGALVVAVIVGCNVDGDLPRRAIGAGAGLLKLSLALMRWSTIVATRLGDRHSDLYSTGSADSLTMNVAVTGSSVSFTVSPPLVRPSSTRLALSSSLTVTGTVKEILS